MYTLARFEETQFSIWLRESGVAFFGSLSVHSLAMAFVVGINIAISLRVLGYTPRFNLQPLLKFYVIHWAAVVAIFLSGLSLLMAYPAKALSNPVFYIKFAALVVALLISRRFQNLIRSGDAEFEFKKTHRNLAILTLVLWVTAVSAGRFLAYTHSVLLASRFY